MGPTRAEPRRIAFLGFGLIGGSIAMALRARAWADARAPHERRPATAPVLVAWTPGGHGPAVGLERRLLDEAPRDAAAAVQDADLVILAAPPLATLDLLSSLAGDWRGALAPAAVVTDVASTKREVLERADSLGLRFVGGHPMAGRELSGVEAGSATLFAGRPWVVVPGRAATADDVVLVEALATWAGATPLRMSAADHDRAVAWISHLPLLASVALVEAVTGSEPWRHGAAAGLAASGWRDATRLAAGSPEMAAGILATNAGEVLAGLHGLRDRLDEWITELERAGGADAGRLRDRLAAARAKLVEAGSPAESVAPDR